MEGAVAMEERRRRNQMLTILSEKTASFLRTAPGQPRAVLFEQSKERGRMSGFTDNYIRIDAPFRRAC